MTTYDTLFSIRRLWMILAASMAAMFGTLLYFGGEIYQAAPPIPTAVRTVGGQTLFTRADIERGQNVWQSIGGMQQGSIWGHGSYVAPDWSADWLHREALALLELLARNEGGPSYARSPRRSRRASNRCLQQAMRTNTYDAQSGVVTITRRPRARDRVRSRCIIPTFSRVARPRRMRCASSTRSRLHATLTAEESRTERVLLLDGLGCDHGAAGRLDHLHEQLAARAARRQHADGLRVHVDVHFDLRAARAASARSSGTTRRSSTSGAATASPRPGFARQDFMNAATVTPSMRATSWYFSSSRCCSSRRCCSAS